jgi:hypothetical protein
MRDVDGPASCMAEHVGFELRHLDSGKLVHEYRTQGAALGFIRDVVRIGGPGAGGALLARAARQRGWGAHIARGAELVQLALEVRAE